MKFEEFDKDTKDALLDNYGAIDFKGTTFKISDKCEVDLTRNECMKIMKMLEKRLRK